MVNYAVELDAVTIVRRRLPILRELSFGVASGSVTGLLGPSGCGKTTLMRAIVGTQALTAGRLTVLGRRAGDAALRSTVGYASQTAAVYADLTVVENVRYFAAALGTSGDDVDRVVEQVNLGGYADRMVGQLSGGQRSRVSLGIALLGHPELLVLDEPTVGLDPVLREQLWSLFGELAAGGMTLLVSSHVMDEAERCDELMLLREGRLLARDTPSALLERTGTKRMDAAFLRLITGEREARHGAAA